MHSGRPGTGSGHSAGHPSLYSDLEQPVAPSRAMLSAGASAGPTAGLSIFRGGSLTHGEPRVLASAGSQYNGTAGNSASASLGPYSPLFSVHGQSSPLATVSPYTGFFSQYPATATHYAPASLVSTARFPHIESYSAVLASMGTHVQHGAHASPQGQTGARAAYLPLGQYSHRSISASSSPGPSAHSPSSGSAVSYSLREREALLQHRRDRDRSPPDHRAGVSPGPPPEDKAHMHPSSLQYPSRSSPGGLLKDVKGEPGDSFQKVPSGKEGSLKHRILTRPSDVALGSAGYGQAKGRAQSVKVEADEVPSKRARYITPSVGAAPAASSSPPDPHVFVAPHALGRGPSAGQYAHHPTTNTNTHASPSSTTTSPSSASYPPHNPDSVTSTEPTESGASSHPHYPPHFAKGSIIQLANGDLKRVEDLQTEDFVSSAQVSADLKVDSSTVVRIEEHPESGTATLGFSVGEHRVQVTVEATLEHPFFVFGQGWSSCSPTRTLQRYALDCHRLTVGDVCISLTHKDVPLKAAEIVSQQQHQEQLESSPKQQGETNSEHHSQRPEELSLKRSPGQHESNQGLGQIQGNGMNEDEGSSESNSIGMDLSSSMHEGHGEYRLGTHQQHAEGPVTSCSSSHDSALDTDPLQKRQWSALESDAGNKATKQTRSDPDAGQN